MRVLLQRVKQAEVTVDGETTGKIGRGLLLFVGIGTEDTKEVLKPMAEKICNMRIFPDEKGRFHYSVREVGGGVLLVPQFTLFADTSKGRRPEFFTAMKPPQAAEMFAAFVEQCRTLEIQEIGQGVFGADMQVSLVNDGPVTIMVDL